jgi:hypothetical protein
LGYLKYQRKHRLLILKQPLVFGYIKRDLLEKNEYASKYLKDQSSSVTSDLGTVSLNSSIGGKPG